MWQEEAANLKSWAAMAYKKVVDKSLSVAGLEVEKVAKSKKDKESFAQDLAGISLQTLRDAVIAKESGKGKGGKAGSKGRELHRKIL